MWRVDVGRAGACRCSPVNSVKRQIEEGDGLREERKGGGLARASTTLEGPRASSFVAWKKEVEAGHDMRSMATSFCRREEDRRAPGGLGWLRRQMGQVGRMGK